MGILISIMIAVNGGLTQEYGIYSATVMIHIVGLLLISAVVLSKRERIFVKNIAWFLYLGGAIGVVTTVFNNLSFGRISVSAILALGLLGQSIAGLVIDQFGLFNMQKHPFTRKKLIGLTLILAGIGAMVNSLEIVAVVVSFIAGVNIVVSRTLNAKLADHTSVGVSTFYNYAIGLLFAVPVFLILGRNEIVFSEFALSPSWYIYLGGVLGVCVVLLANVVVVKVSAFYLTLLIFVGQVFSGILVDIILSGELSVRNLIGGMLVAAGLSLNLILDRHKN